MSVRIIFTHGIMGNNRIFDPLIEEVSGWQGDISCECVTLPGHGGNALDFAASSMAKWQECLDNHVAAAQRQYDHVILVGHSMGGLLSVQSALTYPLKVRGLFMLALPLKISMKPRYAANAVCAAMGWRKGCANVSATIEAAGVSDSNLFHYIATTPRYIELFQKSARTCDLLDRVSIPMLAVLSENDSIVSFASARVAEKAGAQVCRLRESDHFLYTQREMQLCRGRFRMFVSACTGTSIR